MQIFYVTRRIYECTLCLLGILYGEHKEDAYIELSSNHQYLQNKGGVL